MADAVVRPDRGTSDISTNEGAAFLRGDLVDRAEARSRERGEDLQPSENLIRYPAEAKNRWFRTNKFPCTIIIACPR